MPLFDELDVFQDREPRRAALNMALDEALLESSTRPLLRFYRWDHPALSFGYFGKFEDVAEHAVQRDLVRRWTGGGIVFHGEDLTYALVIPSSLRHLHQSSTLVYEAVHAALRDVLIDQGHRASLAAEKSATISEACFARPVVADVMANGRKIAGAAHRRTRAGLLHQGSIQGVDLSEDFAAALAEALSRRCHHEELADPVLARAREIAETKYATTGWLRRR
jgi:lipoyl(octanoyl) transferase